MNTLASYQPRSAWAMASMLTWLSLINFLDKIAPAIQNGTSINGQDSDAWGLSPADDSERY